MNSWAMDKNMLHKSTVKHLILVSFLLISSKHVCQNPNVPFMPTKNWKMDYFWALFSKAVTHVLKYVCNYVTCSLINPCGTDVELNRIFTVRQWQIGQLCRQIWTRGATRAPIVRKESYSFLSHSKLFPFGSRGWAGTSDMFPSSRTGTRTRK